jgi:hypothetical protein
VNDASARIAAMMSDLLAWSERFEAGAITDPAIDPGSGERFAVRVPDSAAVGVLFQRGKDRFVERFAEGDVVATDRRLLVVRGDTILHCWTWATDMGDGASLVLDGLGANFLPSDALHAAGARYLLGVVPKAVLKRRAPRPGLFFPMIAAWSRVVAAYRLSRGELETWRDQQRGFLESNSAEE